MTKEPTVQDYLDVIIKRRLMVIICVIVSTVGALFTSLRLPKVYEAKVRFKLDLSEAKPAFFTELYTPHRVDPVESELEIIRSRSLARSIVSKLGLNLVIKNHLQIQFDSLSISASTPLGEYTLEFEDNQFILLNSQGEKVGQGKIGEVFDNGSIRFLLNSRPKEELRFTITDPDKAAEDLQQNISASQIKNTALVSLKVKSTSPKLAAKIANTLAQEYIQYSLLSLRESARSSKEFIESQRAIFGSELDSAEQRLRRFKEKSGIFLLDESAKEIITSLAQFEVEREKAVVELNEVQSTIKKLEEKLSKDEATYGVYKRMAAFPTLSNSPIILSLRERLKELEMERQELLLDEKKVKELALIEEKIKNTEAEITKASRQIILAGPSIEDPVFQSIIASIINNETKSIALQSRIDALGQIIKRHNWRLKQLPEAEVNLAQLERQKLANEEIYTMLLGKLEEAKIAEAMQMTEAKIIDYATVPTYPIAPKPRQNGVLGLLLGLLVGIGGAFLLEYLDTTLKNSKEIEEMTGISVLGSIPLVKNKVPTEIPTIQEPHSDIAEAYRILRTNLGFMAAAKPIKSLLLTSTLPQEGKTTTCINLGITLAQQGHRVILLECDFRRPMFHRYFKDLLKDCKNETGLSDVLLNSLKLNQVIVKTPFPNLHFVTSGASPANPSELLGSLRMQHILDELKSDYQFILIDAPPALGVADARVLGKVCDAIMVVVMAGRTNRDAVLEVKEELARAGEKIIGYVLNGIDLSQRYYRHRYYSYYRYSPKR